MDGDNALKTPHTGAQAIRQAKPREGYLRMAEWQNVLVTALAQAGVPQGVSSELAVSMLKSVAQPGVMAKMLMEQFGAVPWSMVHGTIDERLFVFPASAGQHAEVEEGARVILCSLGRQLKDCGFPTRAADELSIDIPAAYASVACLSRALLDRMSKPRVKLVALYHPEVFPLPRLALSISDLARALRRQMIGQVSMEDMQLGGTLDEIMASIDRERPDIVGISATFGQQDILHALLKHLMSPSKPAYRPRLIVGGSLAALNARFLIEQFPELVVAGGSGERTICDFVRHYVGEFALEQVNDILFRDVDGEVRHSARISNREQDDILPELDLLDATLAHKGVLQMETSRGCTYACSFCPREHKGMWMGDTPEALDILLPFIGQIYNRQNHISRRIFFVDEEFIGYRPDPEVLPRCLEIAHKLKAQNFRFETSARIDQVYRKNRDRSWHVNRMKFWKELAHTALDRCLFGVESGVDSILTRFNKHTTSDQNVKALRILSGCSIPRRCTYITFDPLMTMDELVASYRFQGRKDILLRPLPNMSEEELYDGVHDEAFVAEYTLGRPFFEEISYMLVTMECLIGSHYSRSVEQAGLAEQVNLSMGRREARFRDPAIGLISFYSQCWVDRNFSLDYVLKSVEKISSGDVRVQVRSFRTLFRHQAYELLGMMLALAHRDEQLLPEATMTRTRSLLGDLLQRWQPSPEKISDNCSVIETLMDRHFAHLREGAFARFEEIRPFCNSQQLSLIEPAMEAWQQRSEWELINAA